MRMNNKKNIKIMHISAVDQVCDRLKRAILSEEWPVGSKLPSEGDLAEMYGVNRLTVRMALQTLSTLGVVETRVGNGTYVRDFSLANIFNEVSDFFSEKKPFDEIYSLRMLIEVECCRLAILNSTPKEREHLKSHLDRYLTAKEVFRIQNTQESFHFLVDEDLLFHYQICRMSHNSVYTDLFFLTRNIIRQYLTEIIPLKNNLWLQKKYQDEPDSHVAIYNALCANDFEACKDAYINTLNISYEQTGL